MFKALLKHIKRIHIVIAVILLLPLLYSSYYSDRFYIEIQRMDNLLRNTVGIWTFQQNVDAFYKAIDIPKYIKQSKHSTSEYPSIELSLSEEILSHLDSLGRLAEINHYFEDGDKRWMPTSITIEGKTYEAEVKLHGTSANSFTQFGKFSFKVKLTEAHKGYKRYRLIMTEEIEHFVLHFYEKGRNLGLIAPDGDFANLTINGDDWGPYVLLEDHTNRKWLKKKYGVNGVIVKTSDSKAYKKSSLKRAGSHWADLDFHFGSWETNAKKKKHEAEAIGQMNNLYIAIKNNDVETFKSLVDEDYWSKYIAYQNMLLANHMTIGDNLKMIYDLDKKKFFPLFRPESCGHYHKKGEKFFTNLMFDIYNPSNELKYGTMHTFRPFEYFLEANIANQKVNQTMFDLHQNGQQELNHYRTLAQKAILDMSHSNMASRIHYFWVMAYEQELNGWLELATPYLNHVNVMLTIDKKNKQIHVTNDCFQDVTMHFNADSTLQIPGIRYNIKQELTYPTQSLFWDGSIKVKDIKFSNTTTGSEVPNERIFINYGTIDQKITSMR